MSRTSLRAVTVLWNVLVSVLAAWYGTLVKPFPGVSDIVVFVSVFVICFFGCTLITWNSLKVLS